LSNQGPTRPISFRAPSERSNRKWSPIISAFLAGDLETVRRPQRTGTRGRILAELVKQAFDAIGTSYDVEPVFQHVPPAPWYVEFAAQHGLKLRVDELYNPDFLLADGTWAEVTLSENTAFKKLLRYGHQAPRLLVAWLDADDGLHKQRCQAVPLPNAEVRPLDWYFPVLRKTAHGADLIRKFEVLRELKGDVC
jgi:hypothetical protein